MSRQRIPVGTFLTATLLAIAVACTKSTVPDPRLVEAYASVMVTRESYNDSTMAASAVRDTLRTHGYTMEEFERQIREASNDPDRYRALLDSVSSSLKRRQ